MTKVEGAAVKDGIVPASSGKTAMRGQHNMYQGLQKTTRPRTNADDKLGRQWQNTRSQLESAYGYVLLGHQRRFTA